MTDTRFMVVNCKHRFIFVHIPKSAGNSLMQALASLEGNNEKWLARTKHETLAEFEKNFWKRKSVGDWLAGRSPTNFYSFCLVRNPWDRMASFYRYLKEKKPRPEIDSIANFREFLKRANEGVSWINSLYSMRSQLDYFTGCGPKFRIGFVGHMEYLDEDLEQISKNIGHHIKIGRYNSSSNSAKDYRQDYDDEMVSLVAHRFANEIALFGYEFEQRMPTRRLSGPFIEGRTGAR